MNVSEDKLASMAISMSNHLARRYIWKGQTFYIWTYPVSDSTPD